MPHPRFRPTILIAASALGLMAAACTSENQAPEAKDTVPATAMAEASTKAAQTLAKVNLEQPIRVLGNEPSWLLDITSTALTYKLMDAPEQRVDNPGTQAQADTATWNVKQANGEPLTLTLTAKDCSDTMSDRIYPLSATLKVGDTTHVGCAAQLSALERAGESGRVE